MSWPEPVSHGQGCRALTSSRPLLRTRGGLTASVLGFETASVVSGERLPRPSAKGIRALARMDDLEQLLCLEP
jgi:hypothetical protein